MTLMVTCTAEDSVPPFLHAGLASLDRESILIAYYDTPVNPVCYVHETYQQAHSFPGPLMPRVTRSRGDGIGWEEIKN